jgi:hypothetical protein
MFKKKCNFEKKPYNTDILIEFLQKTMQKQVRAIISCRDPAQRLPHRKRIPEVSAKLPVFYRIGSKL